MTSKRDTELLELRRKVCEALLPEKNIEVSHGQVFATDRASDDEGWQATRQMPHFESDNGKALDALVKFCKENGVHNAELNIRGKDGECCVEFRDANNVEPYVQVFGATVAIACCKALIATSAKGEK